MTLTVEPFEWWHGRRFGLLRARDDVVGVTLFEGGQVEALILVYEQDGAAWMSVAGKMRPLFLRHAIRLLKVLDECGVAEIYAAPDPKVPDAEAPMLRLGFRPHSAGVWRLELGSTLSGHEQLRSGGAAGGESGDDDRGGGGPLPGGAG